MTIMPRICCFIILFSASLIFSENIDCEYENCEDELHPGKYLQHTMCQYPPGPSARCTNVTQKQLNHLEETRLLKLHNRLRQKVAKGNEYRSLYGKLPAGYIQDLLWDAKLAEIAQRWANQCHYRNDVCRNYGEYRIGQNVGFLTFPSKKSNFFKIFKKWSNEVEQFNPQIIKSYKQNQRFPIAHFTQIIWGNTTHVGCGGVKHVDSRGRFPVYLVCNYRTKGNNVGEAVYTIID